MTERRSDLTRLIERTLGLDDVQALLTGKPRALKPAPDTFPFRTETAEKVWAYVTKLIGEFPELDNQQLLLLAIEKSGVYALDLSAEDWRLLEMAVEAARGTQRWLPNPAIFGIADNGTELPKL